MKKPAIPAWLLLLLATACMQPLPEPTALELYRTRESRAYRSGFLELEDCSLYYEVEGEGQGPGLGPALVLVHGGACHAIFHPVASRFGARHKVVYYDQRGYGQTRVRAGSRSSIPGDVEDLEALRLHLGLEKITLLAWSHGSAVGIDYVRAHPEHVAGLVILSGYADNDDRVMAAIPMVKHILYDLGVSKAHGKVAAEKGLAEEERIIRKWLVTPHTHHHSPVPRSYLEIWSSAGVFKDMVAKNPARSDRDYHRLDELGEITVPVLLLFGRHDAITPLQHGRKMAARIRDCRLVVFEDSGHMIPLEEEERFVDVVESFLDEARK